MLGDKKLFAGAAIFAAVVFIPLTVAANDANFQYSGARQKALSGAGVADGNDATSIALNPAGLVHSPDEWSLSATGLHPLRGFDGTDGFGPGFTPAGSRDSNSNYFLIPNFAWARRVDGGPLFDVVGVSVYGNGGLNTDYPAEPGSPACAFLPVPNPGTGPYCFGKTGVNLQQSFLSIAFAKTISPGLSVGVAPIISRQQIELEGLQAFAGNSVNPAALTNNGTESSLGIGIRGGIEWSALPNLRLAVAGSSRIESTHFSRYSGAFAEGGELDIPASVQAGVAYDVTPAFTLLVDYKHIFFNDVRSYSNPSTSPFPLGSALGPGFGWGDIDIVKVGVEWDYNPQLTLRAGYSYNTEVVGSRDVLFNIISPSTTNHTFSGGLEYRYDKHWSVELAGAYVPYDELTGFEPPPGNPTHQVQLYLEQYEATLGVKYRFGEEPAPLK